MEKFIKSIEKHSWIIALVAVSLAAFAVLFGEFGGIGGGFVSVLASVIRIVLWVGVFAAGITFIALKKKSVLAKYAAAALAGTCVFFFMNSLGTIEGWGDANNGLLIAFAVLYLVEVVGIIVALVFYGIAAFAGKANMLPLAKLVALCSCAFGLVPLILGIVIYAQNGFAWTSYFSLIAETIVIPAAGTFYMLYAFSDDVAPLAEQPVEEASEEPVEEVVEAPAEEPVPEEERPAEEAPAE